MWPLTKEERDMWIEAISGAITVQYPLYVCICSNVPLRLAISTVDSNIKIKYFYLFQYITV